MMRLLLDQGISPVAAQLLRERGIDAVHAGEVGLATATDAAILEFARSENRIVVTLDADFHALLALTRAHGPSVIRIRIERLRGRDMASLLQRVLNEWASELASGVVITVLTDSTPGRLLPLVR
jgi:predicted nuclease of predicted toxin-antitoxin system